MDLRVFVVADDPLVRAGLSALVRADARMTAAGEAGPADLAWAPVPVSGADVILFDAGGDPAGVAEQVATLETLGPPVLALVSTPADAATALWAGARGVLPRDASGERLAAGLIAAASGLVVLAPAFAAVARPVRVREPAAWAEDLTPRELEVLQLLAEGLPNRGIARRLGLSEHTVNFHVDAILGKLDAHSRTEAVTRAARLGLIVF
ncbi:MAG: response regulator transcription factor [Armatimonadota bacterium]|nr:response regulator transcription factor [Armatimonadota bacterium]